MTPDRVGIVTTVVLQVIRKALLAALANHTNATAVHAEVEAILRDEFTDVARETLNEIRREDG